MPHHKRRRPKRLRAGCALCKPWKQNGAKSSGEWAKRPVADLRQLQDSVDDA